MSTSNLNYSEIQRSKLTSATTVRIYGIPLEGANTLDGHIAILWCGFSSEGEEKKEPTKRVWHLPQSKIITSGQEKGYYHEEYQVQWFDLYKDASPIEEQYTPVSLGLELKNATVPIGNNDGEQPNLFAALLGVHPGRTSPGGGPNGQSGGVVLAKKSTTVRGRFEPGSVLGTFCDTLKNTGTGECIEGITNGLATYSVLKGRYDYDNETDTTVVIN